MPINKFDCTPHGEPALHLNTKVGGPAVEATCPCSSFDLRSKSHMVHARRGGGGGGALQNFSGNHNSGDAFFPMTSFQKARGQVLELSNGCVELNS